ncbi:MAG: hypothetical protein ACYCZ8_12810 [Acidimicrobiales bacterium]
MERSDSPSLISWWCPACGEAGLLDGWQDSQYDLSHPDSSERTGRERGRSEPPHTERARTERACTEREGELVSVVIAEKSYLALLDSVGVSTAFQRIIYGASPHPGGVELAGPTKDIDELMENLAPKARALAERALTAKAESTRPTSGVRRRGWLDTSTDVVLEELASFHLVASRSDVANLIRRKVADVANALGITEQSARRYLRAEELRRLAVGAAIDLADEQPGAYLADQARNIPVDLEVLGRCVAGLAEAAQIRSINADEVGTHGALQLLSTLGQFLAEPLTIDHRDIHLPQAALSRGARLLEATAQMISAGATLPDGISAEAVPTLADAFSLDATVLRSLVARHGRTLGPFPDS